MDSIMIQHMRIYRWYVCKCIQIHTVYRTIMFEYGIGFETCVFLLKTIELPCASNNRELKLIFSLSFLHSTLQNNN